MGSGGAGGVVEAVAPRLFRFGGRDVGQVEWHTMDGYFICDPPGPIQFSAHLLWWVVLLWVYYAVNVDDYKKTQRRGNYAVLFGQTTEIHRSMSSFALRKT